MALSRLDCRNALLRLFASMQVDGSALLAALADERDALARREIAALEPLATSKEALVHKLDRHEAARQQLLATAGYANDGEAMLQCLDWCDSTGAMRGHWDEILTTLARCRDQNQVNGGVIDLSRQHMQRALEILHGQGGQGRVYDPKGHTGNSLPGRSLARA